MIEKHRLSKASSITGLILCSVVGIFALTKAPLSMAQQGLDEHITLYFKAIPIETVVELFADFSGQSIEGIDQVAGSVVSISVVDIPARDALTQLLNCVGHTVEPDGEALEIIPLESPRHASFECVDVRIEADRTI